MVPLRDDLRDAPLGHVTGYPDEYDPTLLFALPRAPQREALGIGDTLPFTGVDRWTAYELTWLDRLGKPGVAIANLDIPATSPRLVESKSVKRYLGSFAQSRFEGPEEVLSVIARDLAANVGQEMTVRLTPPSQFQNIRIVDLPGESLDALPVAIDRYEVDASTLGAAGPGRTETLRTDLFRSVCPVTAQPDFASVCVSYHGPALDRAALLRYLVSYRCHAGFHEHCVERIFVDIMTACRCKALSVHARFTRRGGLDINPYRTNAGEAWPANVRTPRQ